MSSIESLFDDAHRRVCIAKERGQIDRNSIWTGMAMPSDMKKMIAKGWMTPAKRETPRVLNWYKFTDRGWEEYDRRYEGKPDWFDPASSHPY